TRLDVEALTLRISSDVGHDEIVHPLLGRVGAQLARACGGDALHAGAVVGPAGAWAIVGPKGAGKSTLLSALAAAGTPVLTDDVLVLRDGVALAGPRCVDLRPGPPDFGPGTAVRPGDPRRRIVLPPIAAEHPLQGLIHLEWSEADIALDPLRPSGAISRLLALRGEKGYPARPETLLNLAALTTVRLRRPRSWATLADSVALVQGLLGVRRARDGKAA
ncbi:MAG: hypothetical protein ACRDLV_01290, partial [Solirubrobacteraceae bacterium]